MSATVHEFYSCGRGEITVLSTGEIRVRTVDHPRLRGFLNCAAACFCWFVLPAASWAGLFLLGCRLIGVSL